MFVLNAVARVGISASSARRPAKEEDECQTEHQRRDVRQLAAETGQLEQLAKLLESNGYRALHL